MATYTPNIPQASDIPAQSQPLLLGNFQSIDDGTYGFALNHVSLTDSTVAQRGKHNFVEMPLQSSPGPTTITGEGTVFVANDLRSPTSPQLWWRPQNQNTNAKDVQLTSNIVPTQTTTDTFEGNGYTFLPGGMLYQWGIVTGSGSYTYSSMNLLNFSFAAVVLISLRTSTLPSSFYAYAVTSFSNTGFSIATTNVGSRDFHFIAIGLL